MEQRSKYVENGRLLRPEELDGDLQRNDYPDMREYVEKRGYSDAIDSFYQKNQRAGGINILEGFKVQRMTRPTLLWPLLAVLVVITGCGSSPPTLPSDTSSAVSEVLTSDSGQEFLSDITTYEWDDDGDAAGARFDWIGGDASSAQGDAASQANQSAAVLADFLLSHDDDLMSVGSGFIGITKMPAAELNPLLIRSYAWALAPYLNRMVSGDDPAFESLRSTIVDDPAALRNMLSVIVADPEGARTLADAANAAAGILEDSAAAAPPDSDDSVADLRAAGMLLGAVAGAVTHTGTTDVPTQTFGEALNGLSVRIATTLVRTDPNPASLSKYIRNGQLMAPADVEREFTADELRSYFLSLRGYLSEKGLGDALSVFQSAFRASSGEAPK